MKLTHKQELFCQEYLKTGNKSEAYREAYDASRMKPETIQNKAYALSKRGDIGARIEELQADLRKKQEYTLQKSIKRDIKLINRYENALDILENTSSADSDIKAADRTIKYIGATGYSQAQDRLSKQLGFYEKDNNQKEVSINLISLGKGLNPE